MKKIFLFLLLVGILMGCNDQKAAEGEFLIGNFGFEPQSNESYQLVAPIEWTGESAVTIQSIELIKDNDMPITYEEDGMEYEFFGAAPLKESGIYGGKENIGDIQSLGDFELSGEGKIVWKLKLGNVVEDDSRRVKMTYAMDGEEHQQIVKWPTLEQLSTN